MKSSFEKKLKTYSTLAAGITVLSPQAFGQIIYTDIPDTIIHNSIYELDLNKDGNIDFKMINYAYQNGSTTSYRANYVSAVGNNEVIGTESYLMSYTFGVAKILENGDDVDTLSDGFWTSSALLFMSGTYYGYPVHLGKWQDAKDKYVGLKFEINGNIHYGWARMDVDLNGDTLILKDFAYESSVEKKIVAGKKVSAVEENDLLKDIFVYTSGKQLYINFGDYMAPDNEVLIYDLRGQLIIHEKNIQSNHSFDLTNHARGYYLVKLVTTDGTIERKIFLQ